MKRNILRVLALVMVLSLVLPMAAFAASTYDLTVKIESDSAEDDYYSVTDSLAMQSGNARLSEVLAQIVLANYERLRGFRSPAMQRLMDEGLAIAGSSGTHSKDEWTAYEAREFYCPYETDLHDKLADYDTTIRGVGTGKHVVKHLNTDIGDAKLGVTYTVTFTITEHSTGGGGGTGKTEPTIEIKDDTPSTEPGSDIPTAGGTTSVDKPDAQPGEEVHIKTEANPVSMIDHITVTDEKDNRILLTYEGQGVYAFEMPEEGKALVDVVYRVIPADPDETGVSELLNTDDHRLYLIGDSEGNFRPNDNVKRSEVATAFFRLLRNQDVARTVHFDDVKTMNWYVQPVEVLASLNIIEGVGNGDFEPDRPITRAEFAAIACRFTAKHFSGTSFKDVSENAWYADAVSTAAHFGWINGVGDGLFEPNRPITRTEAAAIINRMLFRISDWIEVDAGHGRQFPDVSRNFWGRYEISEATNDHGHTLEEKYYYEDWIGEQWQHTVDNNAVNSDQSKS